ncbi:hypothetical protein FACS18942_04800 [Planctomycetales bacterium]|nr:hypothetical protein FACS18942_04800 [Planctomycetales bacterium]
MSGKKSYVRRIIEFFIGHSSRDAAYSKARPLQLESLEVREMLSVVGFHSVVDANEDDSGYFRLERDDVQGQLTVQFQINTGGTNNPTPVIQGEDFLQLPGTSGGSTGSVTFAHGERFADISVHAIDDSIVENTEQIRLVLVPNAGGTTPYSVDPLHRTATMLIEDNDVPPQVWIDSVINGVEGESNGRFILKRSDTDRALTVSYTFDNSYSSASYGGDHTVAGLQYYYSTGTVIFAAGSDTAEIIVNINEDTITENPESVILRLASRTMLLLQRMRILFLFR